MAPMNSQRDGACVVTEGRYMYVISGYDGHNYLSSVEMYDPSTNEWAIGGKLDLVLPVTFTWVKIIAWLEITTDSHLEN